jgi:hypothetical protein
VRRLCLALLLAPALAAPARAEPAPADAPGDAQAALSAGDVLPALALADQHGRPQRLDEGVRLVLFTRDMDAGRLVQRALSDADAVRLSQSGAVYVSDVSRMPRLVRRIVAKPRMRQRPYPMLLDEEGEATAALPSREGRVTLLFLERLRVSEIRFAETPEEVAAALAGRRNP